MEWYDRVFVVVACVILYRVLRRMNENMVKGFCAIADWLKSIDEKK